MVSFVTRLEEQFIRSQTYLRSSSSSCQTNSQSSDRRQQFRRILCWWMMNYLPPCQPPVKVRVSLERREESWRWDQSCQPSQPSHSPHWREHLKFDCCFKILLSHKKLILDLRAQSSPNTQTRSLLSSDSKEWKMCNFLGWDFLSTFNLSLIL